MQKVVNAITQIMPVRALVLLVVINLISFWLFTSGPIRHGIPYHLAVLAPSFVVSLAIGALELELEIILSGASDLRAVVPTLLEFLDSSATSVP